MSWGVVAAAGAAVVGGALAADGAKSAADTQAGATNAATAENRRQYDQTRADYQPYREAGTKALGTLQTEMDQGVTAADVMSDPGYQFGLTQGQLGLDRKIAASGGRVSGAAMKAASQYNTGYATTGYNAAYQRKQDRLNRLSALAGIGQSATGSSAAAGASAAGANASLISSQGNATAANQIAQGNIWGNAINQVAANWAGQKNPNSFTASQIASANSWNVPTSAQPLDL